MATTIITKPLKINKNPSSSSSLTSSSSSSLVLPGQQITQEQVHFLSISLLFQLLSYTFLGLFKRTWDIFSRR